MRIAMPARFLALLLTAFLALTACKSAQERANEYYQNGLTLLESGDMDRAILEFRNVFELDPAHLEARQALGRIYLEQGARRRAYRQFLRIVEQSPDDVDTRIILAEIALMSGNLEEVTRHGTHVQQITPEDPRVQAIGLVLEYSDAARADDASALPKISRNVEAMLQDQPDSVFLRMVSIDESLRNGEFDKALEYLDWILVRNPDNQRFMMQRLNVLAQLDDNDAIEAQLQDMIARFPGNDSHKATLIRFYMSRNDIDKAEAFLRERAHGTDDAGMRMDLVQFLLRVRGQDAAREELRVAISDTENPIAFQILLAALDFEGGDQQGAITVLEDLVRDAENTPETLNAKITLARMQLATGNEVGAQARVAEVLAADEGHVDALKMQAVWNIDGDDADEAIAGLRLALDREPDDAQAMTLMAQAYQRSGRPELARDFMALAVEASGNAPAETIRYAQVLIEEENYRPAEDILLNALRLAPRDLDLVFIIGELYLLMEDMGRVDQVVRTLRGFDEPRATAAANRLEAERINRQSGSAQAIAYLEELAGSADSSLSAQMVVVRAKLSIGDIEGARELILRLREEMPDAPAVKAVQAGIEAALGNIETAETMYLDLLADDPQISSGIWLELARLKVRQEDPTAFRAAIDEGLTHLPEDPQLLWAKASYLERDGLIDEAVAIYETLYARNSNAVVIANNLASLLGTYKDDPESLERAWAVARRFREADIPELQDTYGWILHRRGESEDALPYLEAAAVRLPNDPIVQYHLAETYNALNRREDALKQYQAAVRIAGLTDQRPQIDLAKEKIQALQEPSEN